MHLEHVIRDCLKLQDIVVNKSFEKRSIEVSDTALLGIWNSLIQKAKTVEILFENKQTSEINIILRSFIEQVVYLKFILKENTAKRAEAFFYFQKYSDTNKVYKAIEKGIFGDKTEYIRNGANKIIRSEHNDRQNLEQEKKYFEEKYKGYLPEKVKKIDNWFSFETLNKYNTFADLAKDIGMADDYWMYKLYSSDIHGVSAARYMQLVDVDSEKMTGHISIGYPKPEVSRETVSVYMISLFFEFSKFYKVNRLEEIKMISMEMKMNTQLSMRSY